MWTRKFESQSFNIPYSKNKDFQIIQTSEFDFYRCLEFSEDFYGKTISELHAGNLRDICPDNRYASVFSGHKISYWSGDKKTAILETKKHGHCKNRITFHAYDDPSSTFPTTRYDFLRIIDGREHEIEHALQKIEKDGSLADKEQSLIDSMMQTNPDAVVYRSVINGKENFIFFENGFKKISLRSVELYLGEYKSRNRNLVACAVTSDYSPVCEAYGCSFEPKARVKMNEEYLDSQEYKERYTTAYKCDSKSIH